MPAAAPSIVLLMGVAGSGKTTVGRALAADLGWPFADADDFHSAANRAKMAAGQPLDDTDRAPWLAALRRLIDDTLAADAHLVLACSALRQTYRDRLLADPTRIRLVFLHGSPALLRERLARRRGHFLPAALLDSQLAALEPPADALTLDLVAPPDALVHAIRAMFAL